MPYVEVWVEPEGSVEDASDNELLDELKKRQLPCEMGDSEEDLNRIFYALYFGRDNDAMVLMRKFVQDVTGRVLP